MTSETTLAPDDETRAPAIVDADSPDLAHLAVVGDTYTILIAGADTAGRYALIDMLVPPGGGPPPHRHDFEEMFHVLEGEIEVTIRGQTQRVAAGQTANVPSLAPHRFTNSTERPVRLLCGATPAGIERFFAEIGDPVTSRTSPPPELSEEQRTERMQKAIALAPVYGQEIV